MILNVDSDASYMSAGYARSCTGGYGFLGSIPRDVAPIQLNDNIAITRAILKILAASAAKAEPGALFVNTTGNKSHTSQYFRVRTHTSTYTNTHRQYDSCCDS